MESGLALDREQLRDVTMGDDELMNEVLDALWDDTSAQIVKLEAAVRTGDGEQCARIAHYSKGACANVGASAAAAIFRQIEQQGKEARMADCSASLSALATAMQDLKVEIAKVRV
jgi:HPt (histidine-containing phosphotransfer) domain-containing protein